MGLFLLLMQSHPDPTDEGFWWLTFQTWNASGADNLVLPAPLAVQNAAHAAERCTVFTVKVGSATAGRPFSF